jgi:hypothetical protein
MLMNPINLVHTGLKLRTFNNVNDIRKAVYGMESMTFHNIHSFSCHLHPRMCIVLNNFMVQVFNLAIGNIQQYIFYNLT